MYGGTGKQSSKHYKASALDAGGMSDLCSGHVYNQ
jgi:hypothetical protein